MNHTHLKKNVYAAHGVTDVSFYLFQTMADSGMIQQ